MSYSIYLCDRALIGDTLESDIVIRVRDGLIESADPAALDGHKHGQNNQSATHLTGITVPGLANAHSHAFHRALRSRTQADSGTFWTWRDLMYRAAANLNPDNYYRLARATFGEMALAGVSAVGEFHYIHHNPDGSPYADPNAMGEAVLNAASDAGIRITLLDTIYLQGGITAGDSGEFTGQALQPNQLRFGDGSVEAWVARVESLSVGYQQRVGAAIHSIRAVDPKSIASVAHWAVANEVPLHCHVSEQRAENEQSMAAFGVTPMQLLADCGALNDRFTAIHATHLTDGDVALLASGGSTVCMCPTTERDLGDGIGPTAQFAAAGVPMAIGSDSNAVIDMLAEARALEMNERLRSESRGVHPAQTLLAMASENGHASLGWNAGKIEPGRRADLVTIDPNTVRTAGADHDGPVEMIVFAATSADVTSVVVDGQRVVEDGRHCSFDVAAELQLAIGEVMDQ